MNPDHLTAFARELDEIRARNQAAILAFIEARMRARLARDATPAPPDRPAPLLPPTLEGPCRTR